MPKFLISSGGPGIGTLDTRYVKKSGDTMTGQLINSTNGAASTPPLTLTGTWFTGGTGTTTKPQLLVEPAGATSTSWNTLGTGIGVNAASGFTGYLIDLQLNGTSKLSVNSAGNVTLTSTDTGGGSPTLLLINTSASGNTVLTMKPGGTGANNTISMQNSVGAIAGDLISDANNGLFIEAGTNLDLIFRPNNGTELMRLIGATAKVAVGSSIAGSKFHVQANTHVNGFSGITVDSTNNTAGNYTGIQFASNSISASYAQIRHYTGASTGGYPFAIEIASQNNGNILLTPNGTGNVGIGTSVPNANLQVLGGQSSALTGTDLGILSVFTTTAGDNLPTKLTFGNSQNTLAKAAIGMTTSGAGSTLRFGTSNNFAAGVTNTAMTIDPAGNLGIGTVSPIAKLNLFGTGASTGVNLLTQASTGAFGLAVLDNGNVGIGTTTPTNILSLSGQAARIIWTERNTTAATAGQNLTLSVGGAVIGGTNLSGGDLLLRGGISTGTGISNVYIQTATAGSTGTSDNTPSTKFSIVGNGAYFGTVDVIGTVGVSTTLDVTKGNIHTITSTASTNMTITPSAAGTAGQHLWIIITSDATGGDIITFASTFKPNGTMTLTASKGHTIHFISDGSAWYEVARTLAL